jgi:cytohesin
VADDRSEATPSELVDPLRRATDQSSLPMVSLLLDAGAPPDDFGAGTMTALHGAARRGHTTILERQLESATSDDVLDRFGYRPVDYAAYFGHSAAFEILWSAEATRGAINHDSNRLHHAAHGGDIEILSALLTAGFAVERLNSVGQTPLHLAVSKGHISATSLLLSRGARVSSEDEHGQSPLHLSASRESAELVQLLLQHQPAVDRRDHDGNTALHYAAAWAHAENVRALLQAGANPAIVNAAGETALEIAAASQRRRIVEILRAADAPAP